MVLIVDQALYIDLCFHGPRPGWVKPKMSQRVAAWESQPREQMEPFNHVERYQRGWKRRASTPEHKRQRYLIRNSRD